LLVRFLDLPPLFMDGPILVESPNIAGGDWNTVAEIVRKYTQKAVIGMEKKPNTLSKITKRAKIFIEAKPTDEGGQVATRLAEAGIRMTFRSIFALINNACCFSLDMDVFGLNPLDDSLNLVTCPNCSKPIKNSRFAAHWGTKIDCVRLIYLMETHSDHCAKEGPRRAIEEEEVLEEGTSVGQSNDPLKLKIKKVRKTLFDENRTPVSLTFLLKATERTETERRRRIRWRR
jgi:hypothetical protein